MKADPLFNSHNVGERPTSPATDATQARRHDRARLELRPQRESAVLAPIPSLNSFDLMGEAE
jgi:hypothetical protein